MKTCFHISLSVAVTFISLLCSTTTAGEPPAIAKPPVNGSGEWQSSVPNEDEPAQFDDRVSTLPVDLHDASFDRFVDLLRAGEALNDRDATLLIDVALQLADGERVLMRSHRSGMSAAMLFAKAIAIASMKRDQASLERLASAGQVSANQSLIDALKSAKKLCAESRGNANPLAVSLESLDVDGIVRIKLLADAVDDARVFQDSSILDTIATESAQLPVVQKRAIDELVSNVRQEIPNVQTAEAHLLLRLGSASRGWGIPAPKIPKIPPIIIPHIPRPDMPDIPRPDIRPPADELWGEAGRLAIPAAAGIMASRNANRTAQSLPRRDREVLRPYFGDLVDRASIRWGADPLNEWKHGSFRIDLGGVDAGAQTYGNQIYMRYGREELSDYKRLKLLIHELTHVQQYQKHGGLSGFGYQYFKHYKRANQSYAGNKLEQDAEQNETRLIGRVKRDFDAN